MPFLSEKRTRKRNHLTRKAIILRMYHPHTFFKLTFYPQNKLVKRVSRVAYFPARMEKTNRISVKGAATVEAAAAIPLFLCFFINIISIMLLFHVFASNLEALHQRGRQLAMLAAATGEITELNDEMIELVQPVVVHPPVPLLGYKGTMIVNCCYMRAWTGYDAERSADQENQEDRYVFLTENGSVYHTRESCTHLTLSIELTSKEQVHELRNEDGGRYLPCEKCGGDGSSLVYVTREGDRYHNTITCSGLKRSIRRVTLSEAVGLPACGRCG